MDAAPLALKRESGRFVLSGKLFLSDFTKVNSFLLPISHTVLLNPFHIPTITYYRLAELAGLSRNLI